jgi:hypothetical protein
VQQAAVASERRAALLEQTAPDVFAMHVGNIPAHGECIIDIRYMTEVTSLLLLLAAPLVEYVTS